MMRPHCDRCDALCDECQTWVEDKHKSDVSGYDEALVCNSQCGGYLDINAFRVFCSIDKGHVGQHIHRSPGAEIKWDRTVALNDHIWHIVIHAGGQVPCEEKMFCRACRIAILEAHVKNLKENL